MRHDTDSFRTDGLPQFLPQTEQLLCVLRSMTARELQTLWKCSDSIAAQNLERLTRMDLRHDLTPAILSYEGIQYQCMAPGVMETDHLDYIRQRLRILSGFYGLLRPFDGVTPYRLEMQAKLRVGGSRNLYHYWGDRLARRLTSETDFILNLASGEYSKAVKPYLPPDVQFVTCTFGEIQNGKVTEKGTMCKMARGQMVRWLAENRITDQTDIQAFDRLNYRYRPELSEKGHMVFVKDSPNV